MVIIAVATVVIGAALVAGLVFTFNVAQRAAEEQSVTEHREQDLARREAELSHQEERMAEPATDDYGLDYAMSRIDGSVEHLGAYKGRVVLIVNVASKCGLTPQYEGLQTLYESRRDKGFEILAFPANNFRGQEPGTNEEILAFCSENYDVTFPMFSKIDVIEDGAHPLFQQLAREGGEAPTWNFTKYLVDQDGHVVSRFDPRTAPDDPDLVARIDALLEG